MMTLTDTRVFLELAKIAKQRGTLTPVLHRTYKFNANLANKRRMAAASTATKVKQFAN